MRKSIESIELDIDRANVSALYIQEAGKFNLLTQPEEVELAISMENGKAARGILAAPDFSASEEERKRLTADVESGEAARNTFIVSNLRLVVSIAKRSTDRGLPLEDLVQEGNMGLFRAVEKFDHRKGWRFSTYASWWIRQAVTRGIVEQSRTIRLPVHVSETVSQAMKVSEKLQQEWGREPSTEELAEELDADPDTLRIALRAAQKPVSLELAVGEDQDGYLGDLVEDEDAQDPPQVAGQNLLAEEIHNLMDCLSSREKRVICLRFGIGGDAALTLDEVGVIEGVTRERVRQIERGALAKLKRNGNKEGHLEDHLKN